jgi:hypothetical protein
MSSKFNLEIDPAQPGAYQIRLKGHLGRQWTDWFEGLTISLEENGDTLLTGPVVDQAALHGVLKKVRDLGMPLLSVVCVEPDPANASTDEQENSMKAIVCTKYGPPEVLQLKEVAKPIPKNNEVLIRIFATAVTSSDCIVRGFKVARRFRLLMGLAIGFTKPRKPILGMVLAGEIESTGKEVTRFKEGDQVYAFNIRRFGAYAEHVCLPEKLKIKLRDSAGSERSVHVGCRIWHSKGA